MALCWKEQENAVQVPAVLHAPLYDMQPSHVFILFLNPDTMHTSLMSGLSARLTSTAVSRSAACLQG